MKQFNPPHPGEVLRGLYLDALNITITAAAEALGVTRKSFSELVNAHAGVSPIMALRLARGFGTTPELWMNLQRDYDLWQGRKMFKEHEVQSLYQGA